MTMTSYKIISRKYRPQTFSSIAGQEAIVTTLKNALRSGKLANAYLFCGCRGTGKTTFARILAKALNCSQLTDSLEPCNACPACLDVNGGRSLDVLEIDGASNRGIDDIRNLNETIGYAPALGKFKIYIIDEVHMLTKEAFNALLKTLEEPPSHVKFFFATTEPHKIPPTIISRCQRFDLSRIAPPAMIQKLKRITQELNVSCEEEAFELIAHLSEGSLRDAESLLDQIVCSIEPPITLEKLQSVLGLMPQRAFFALDRAFDTHSLSYAFELAQEVFASGKDFAHFLDMLLEHYHTLLQIKLGRTHKEAYSNSAAYYTTEQCLYILDYLIEWQQQVSKIPFKRIFLEMVLLHILRSKYQVTQATLVKRLLDLEHKLPKTTAEVKPAEVAAPKIVEEVKPAEVAAPKIVEEVKPTEVAAPKIVEEVKLAEVTVVPPAPEGVHPSRYQTLLQFAAIELEGSIKKEI